MAREITDKHKVFIVEYLKEHNANKAYQIAFYDKLYPTGTTKYSNADIESRRLLADARIQAEIARIQEPLEITGVSSAAEVMRFFSSVMRGEVKDQFGLEAPLSERLKAANELAKRTIDIENRAKGISDAKVEVTLNWDRDE